MFYHTKTKELFLDQVTQKEALLRTNEQLKAICKMDDKKYEELYKKNLDEVKKNYEKNRQENRSWCPIF